MNTNIQKNTQIYLFLKYIKLLYISSHNEGLLPENYSKVGNYFKFIRYKLNSYILPYLSLICKEFTLTPLTLSNFFAIILFEGLVYAILHLLDPNIFKVSYI